jgi:alpha-ribazole phosphatase
MKRIVAPNTDVILVRHGETGWNAGRRVQGHTDVPLSEEGRRQAVLLAPRLAREPIGTLYASDLSRAIQTAEPAAMLLGLTVHVTPAFREAHYGEWEGLTVEEIQERYPAEYREWRRDSAGHRPPAGESIEMLQARVMRQLEELLERHGGETVGIVAHGGSVRAAICGLLNCPIDIWRALRTDNTGISRIHYTPLGPQLILFNDTGHLHDSEHSIARADSRGTPIRPVP